MRRFHEKYPHLFPDDADDWLSEVLAAADEGNELVHAVALNRLFTVEGVARVGASVGR
jgi:hypothetical protein